MKKNLRITKPSLPEDIIIDILSMLSVKSIARFRCVCKRWYELFKYTKFIKMHLQHAIQNNKFSVLIGSFCGSYYSIDFDVTSASYHMAVETSLPPNMFLDDEIRIDSCDGLIGLSSRNARFRMICLWNPSTREYKDIPMQTSNYDESHNSFSEYGVCYDWKIDDYKLFNVVVTEECDYEVWVSRLGSNIWKRIGNVPYDIRLANVQLKTLNGIIHWIGNTKVIVSLDIVEEEINEIQIPSCYLDDESNESYYPFNDWELEVGVLGDRLHLSVNAISGKGSIDLWVMEDYGVVDSWTKIFSLSQLETKFDLLWPLQYLNKNREILLHGVYRTAVGTKGCFSLV